MMFSRKDLIKITVPLMIQQVLAVLVSMVDSMMVSSVGEAAISGVSLIGSLDMVLIILFSSMVTGGAVVVSQALGQGDKELVRDSAKQLIYVATGVALAVSVVVLTFRGPLLHLLFGDAEAAVMQNAMDYFLFMAMSFPFLAVENAGAALFRSMGDSMTSMLISVGMNLMNVAGNALLIYGCDMGASGAAISTLFARVVGAVVALVLLHNKKNPIYLERILHYRPDFRIIRRILRIGIPSGIENSMFQFGKLMTQSLISSMGTVSIAANAVALNLVNFQYMPGNAIGLAIVTVVGRCIGAGERVQAKKYARGFLLTTYCCLWAINLATLLLADPLISLYQPSEETARLVKFLLLFHAGVTGVIWPIAFTTPHAFRAASDVKFPLVVSIVSMWVFRVAFGYVLSMETIDLFGFSFPGFGLGISGVWIAMFSDWIFRAILFGIRFFSGKWLTKYKKE
ncbi:MAG: MATE family efflux transporter [Clostridia bacterium]|nr:MATE family efflux transporter [Clostridia bacterium]